MGKVCFIKVDRFHYDVVINCVIIFIVIIWSDFIIIDPITTLFKLNIFLCAQQLQTVLWMIPS